MCKLWQECVSFPGHVLYMDACVYYIHLQADTCAHVCACEQTQRPKLNVVSNCSLPLSLETRSPTEPTTQQLTRYRLASQIIPGICLLPPNPALGFGFLIWVLGNGAVRKATGSFLSGRRRTRGTQRRRNTKVKKNQTL